VNAWGDVLVPLPALGVPLALPLHPDIVADELPLCFWRALCLPGRWRPPIFASPDEPSHLVHAIRVAHGD
jgi:hypothetical protein